MAEIIRLFYTIRQTQCFFIYSVSTWKLFFSCATQFGVHRLSQFNSRFCGCHFSDYIESRSSCTILPALTKLRLPPITSDDLFLMHYIILFFCCYVFYHYYHYFQVSLLMQSTHSRFSTPAMKTIFRASLTQYLNRQCLFFNVISQTCSFTVSNVNQPLLHPLEC